MQSTSDFAEYLELIDRESEHTRQQEASLRQQIKQVRAVRRILDKLRDPLQQGHFAHTLLVLRKNAKFMHELQASEAAVAPALQRLCDQLQQDIRSSAANIAHEFPAALHSHAIKIDSTSRHPIYTFNEGFLRVELDDKDATATITPRDGKKIVVGLDVDLVVETLRAEKSRLFHRQINSQSFLRSVLKSYTAILRAEQLPAGDAVPLRSVVNRLATNRKHFSADEFNIDLAELVQQNNMLVDGKRIKLNHTRDSRKGMLLHGLESGGYMGFISFKPERKEQS